MPILKKYLPHWISWLQKKLKKKISKTGKELVLNQIKNKITHHEY